MKLVRLLLVFCLLIPTSGAAQATTITDFKLEFWADNWATVYVNGIRVAVDPVPITTTKSFNKVSANFKASYPLTIAVVAKDYVENQSGLEYIGTSNQQIGDAGFILQIKETKTGKLAAATSSAWKSLILFRAPLNPECVTSKNPLVDCNSSTTAAPTGWYGTKFVDSKWASAKEYYAAEVGVKDGYNEVSWGSQAKLIWTGSLTQDNTVLFRFRATSAVTQKSFDISAPGLTAATLNKNNTCDGAGTMPQLTWSGAPTGTKTFLLTMDTPSGPVRAGEPTQTDFNHLVIYNLPATAVGFGSTSRTGIQGKNFKGTLGFTPPCSQGPGLKTYTFHLYALSDNLAGAALTGPQAISSAKSLVLATAELSLSYTR